MKALADGLTLSHSRAVALALLHFLWQGALVASLYALTQALLARASARARYVAACAALAAMLALPVATAWRLARPSLAVSTMAPSASLVAPAAKPAKALPAGGLGDSLGLWDPWIVSLWLAGVAVLSVRLTGGFFAAERLRRRHVRPARPEWELRMRELGARLCVRRPVRLLESLRIEIPATLGILRPAILLPAAMATGLTAEQLDALLAHELAHVRRRDFLVGLLQAAAETLLFYHPAVWWVSHRIRVERENACDDLAVAVTGDRTVYARALLALEERRAPAPRLALAADGSALFHRIARLLRAPASRSEAAPRLLAVAVSLGGILAAAALAALASPVRTPGSPASQTSPPATAEPARPASPTSAPRSERSTPSSPKNSGRLSPQQLVAFRIHGVTPEFIDAIQALGYEKVSADDLVALRIHEVTPEFIRTMSETFGRLPLDDYVAFRIHGVTPEFAREMRGLGLTHLSADDVVAFRIHGVTPKLFQELRGLGYESLSADDLTAFRIHGVTPEYIRSMNARAGGLLSADDLIEDRIHGRATEEENP